MRTPAREYAFENVPGYLEIYGTKGSFAESFAEENGYTFKEGPMDLSTGFVTATFTDPEGNPLEGVSVVVYNLTDDYEYVEEVLLFQMI